jgi:hypothetical protein
LHTIYHDAEADGYLYEGELDYAEELEQRRTKYMDRVAASFVRHYNADDKLVGATLLNLNTGCKRCYVTIKEHEID